jgi:glycosyltransferase involved in cell wall biosynthesis
VLTTRVDELCAAARQLVDNPGLAGELGRAGRRHALEHYGLKRFLSDWDELLTGLRRPR